VHPSPDPRPKLVLVVPGRHEQFGHWMQAPRVGRVESVNRVAGSFITTEGVKYQACATEVQTLGLDRGTPVILIGTWWNLDWVHYIRERFTDVTTEEF
jgi:hypothetical protein